MNKCRKMSILQILTQIKRHKLNLEFCFYREVWQKPEKCGLIGLDSPSVGVSFKSVAHWIFASIYVEQANIDSPVDFPVAFFGVVTNRQVQSVVGGESAPVAFRIDRHGKEFILAIIKEADRQCDGVTACVHPGRTYRPICREFVVGVDSEVVWNVERRVVPIAVVDVFNLTL